MKKYVALLLALCLSLTGCGLVPPKTTMPTEAPATTEATEAPTTEGTMAMVQPRGQHQAQVAGST